MKLGKSILKSYPPFIKIDPSPICNLRCPDCKQSNPEFKKKFNEKMTLTLDNLKKVIEPISSQLLGVSLSLNGDPFTNKHISELISYLHKKKISVNFPTNFSVEFSDDEINSIISSGLDTLYISLDGTNEDSYKKYRVGGNFELVKNNVIRFQGIKRKLKTKRPNLIWKFVVFEHNRDEVELVKELYKDWHFDSYRIDLSFTSEFVRNKQKEQGKKTSEKKKKCFWLWNTFMVLWDGTVYPCCNWNFETEIFHLGNAFENNITDIWNSQPYRTLRQGFSKKYYASNLQNFCKECMGLN